MNAFARATVTVVIPCFNQGRFLTAAIRSVQVPESAGSPADIELIVVDDGSSDDTARIARELGARVREQPNLGLSSARNAGLEAARGEFVVFLDADDELLPDAIASGIAEFEARPNLACVLRHCLLIDPDGSPLPTRAPAVEHGDVYAELLHRNVTWAPGAAMFRRSDVVAVGGFPLDAAPAGDYALYLRFARVGRLAYLNMPAARYRQHDHNMSRDPVVMLTATLRVLAAEWAVMPPAYRREWAAGWRDWCAFYGDQIVDRMRLEWRGRRRVSKLAGDLFALVDLCPRVALRHAARKLLRILRGLPAARLGPSGRFSAASGRTRNAGR